ncbi:ankyrin repeat family protein [Zopfochytrium polystomum]|nr:ankyrin repeat family protein [Zopfochytrium polystomum]
MDAPENLLAACRRGEVASIGEALRRDANAIHERDSDSGASPLHYAAATGSAEAVNALLSAGHPWNEVDFNHKTAAEYARDAGHPHIWDLLLAEGVRVEFILSMLEKHDENDDVKENEGELDGASTASNEAAPRGTPKVSNADYLAMRLKFEDDRLIDEQSNGVMMGWEAPLMQLHADIIAPRKGLDVLNVGFGLGIIDRMLQEKEPNSHTIIEAHPDVYRKMLADGWDKKKGVRILFGRWQEVLDQLESYDGIFFDTFGEYYNDLKEFHEHVPNILREDGIYSYFNGLAAGNPFFHEVSCAVAEADLQEMGLQTETRRYRLEPLGDAVWQGIRRAYFTLDEYRLPICTFSF